MDTPKSEILSKALLSEEIEQVPSDIAKKLENFCESRNEDFMKVKVLYDTAQNRNGEYNRIRFILCAFSLFHPLLHCTHCTEKSSFCCFYITSNVILLSFSDIHEYNLLSNCTCRFKNDILVYYVCTLSF